MIDELDDRGRHVIHVGEIPPHVAAVEQLDRPAVEYSRGEQPHRHIGPAPRAIHGEEPQAGDRKVEQVRIGVRHQLVGFLGRTIEVQRVIDILSDAERQFRVGAVDGRR